MAENEPPVNPYQSPSEAGQSAIPTIQARNLEHFQLVKQFRQQIHALGGFWIFIGCLAFGICIFLIVAANGGIFGGRPEDNLILLAICGVAGSLWMTVGVGACFKQLWAVYLGLGLSYVSVAGNLLRLNVCGLIILAVVILQAHRVLGFAKRLKWLGIPLTTQPSQLTMQVAPPPGQWPV